MYSKIKISSTIAYAPWHKQDSLLKAFMLTVGTVLLMSLSACQDTQLIDPNIASDIEDDPDDAVMSNLKVETLQVLTDIPPVVQQALSEAYFIDKNIRIGWLDINENTDSTLIDMDISATVVEPVLIEPNEPEPINLDDTMSAEEALLNGVPLPQATSTLTDNPTGVITNNATINNDTTNNTANANQTGQAADTPLQNTPNTAQVDVTVEAGQAVVIKQMTDPNGQRSDGTANNTDTANNDPNYKPHTIVDDNSNATTEADEVVISMKDHYHLPDELDVLLLHSVYDMQKLAHHNQLQPLASQMLLDRISQTYHDPDGYWVGLSMYGRTMVYNKDTVDANKLLNYAKLADPMWRDRLCLTDFRYPDNQAILQIMKTHRGLRKTRELLTDWQLNMVGNTNGLPNYGLPSTDTTTFEDPNASAAMQANNSNSIVDGSTSTGANTGLVGNAVASNTHASSAQGLPASADSIQNTSIPPPVVRLTQQQINELYYKDDQGVLDAIDSGRCDVGIVNSDSFMWYVSEHRQTPVRLTWSNQINHGTATNAISASIAKQSDDTAKALDFIEWLAGDKGQALLAFYSKTYPIADITDPSIDIQAVRPKWSEFKADLAPLANVFETLKEQETAH